MQETHVIENHLKEAKAFLAKHDIHSAVQHIQKVFQHNVNHYEALRLMALACKYANKNEEAENFLLESLKSKETSQAWADLASVHLALNKPEAAILSANEALKLDGSNTAAILHTGNAYLNKKMFQEAGQVFLKLLELEPENHLALWAISYSLYKLDRIKDVYPYITKCLELCPNIKMGNLIMGNYYESVECDIRKAISFYKKELEFDPGSDKANGMIASAYAAIGEPDKAIEFIDKQLKVTPKKQISHGNKIQYLQYNPKAGPPEILQAANDLYQAVFANENFKTNEDFSHLNLDPKKKQLRVGFVSGDLKKHAVLSYLRGFIEHLGDEELEIIAFCNNKEDVASEVLKPHFNKWFNILDKNDEEVFDLVKENNIDILFDLSGHTALNRLRVFAMKPSPVQVSWLGMTPPLGMPQVDYNFVNQDQIHKGEEKYYTEIPYNLPNFYLAYPFPEYDIAVEQAPFNKNGFITFGVFNRFTKLNHEVLKFWARLLKEIPNSKILFKAKLLNCQSFCDELYDFFSEHAIDRDRLILEPHSRDKKDYLRAFNDFDIGLDPFPFCGGTTSLDSFFMSTPYITLAGDTITHRAGLAMLKALELDELVAYSQDQYIEIAKGLAANPERINTYKETIREKFRNSSICNTQAFANEMKQAFFAMWQEKLG